MPKRVLLMISSMRGGGSEQQTLLLLRHLNRAQFEPHLYVTERAGDLLARIPDDVPVHSFADVKPGRGIYYPGRVLRQQQRHLADLLREQSIDVIYDRTFHMTMIAGPAAKQVGVPRVSTIVSLPDRALPLVETRFVGLKRRRLAKAYRQARHVIAVSQQAADSAESFYGLPVGRVSVIPNPVDVGAVSQAAHEFTVQRDAAMTLVCVGRMTAEKGQRDLIDAVFRSRVRPLKLWLIGDGPLRSELQFQVQQCRLRSSGELPDVEFLESLRNPLPFIAAADALVLPSLFEGMPNVVLEAMALRKPVIATRAGGTIELERDQPTIWWAQPGDANSLAAAIDQFVNNADAARARVDVATQMIAAHHDVSRAIGKIGALLATA
jgi:glycosyltransferase involved in cell wall biosynthesis